MLKSSKWGSRSRSWASHQVHTAKRHNLLSSFIKALMRVQRMWLLNKLSRIFISQRNRRLVQLLGGKMERSNQLTLVLLLTIAAPSSIMADDGICYAELGCLSIDSTWFSYSNRPFNPLPMTRDEINTTFTLHTRTIQVHKFDSISVYATLQL